MRRNTLKVLLIALMATGFTTSFAQNVGINSTGVTPNAAAILDLNTGNAGNQGFFPEKVALTATNTAGPITSPPTGLLVYNTATAGVSPDNVVPGYYFNAGTPAAPNWVQFVAGNNATNNITTGGWLLNGNIGTNPALNFVGTTDANAFNFRTNNVQRMTILSTGQVGINSGGLSPNTAAILDLNTGNTGNGGFLPEQVALTATNSAGPITSPPNGLIVYNTVTAGASPNNVVPGYYYNAGTPATPNWELLVAGNSATNTGGGWLLNGNTGTNPATNFIGTTDANALNFKTNNTQRMTILSGGNVGINAVAPGSTLEVDGAAVTQVANFQNTNTSTSTSSALQGINTAAVGTGNGSGITGVSSQSAGFGVVALNNNNSASVVGTGLYAAGAGLGLNFVTLANAAGAILVGPYGGFGYSPYNGGNGLWGYSNGNGSLGVYGQVIGTSAVGVFGQATGATSTGGDFQGTSTGAYAAASVVASGIGVIGLGNGITTGINPNGAGCGGTFSGVNVGAYGFATTGAVATGVVGLGNNLATYQTYTSGSGGAFTGSTVGVLGSGSTVASGTGVVGEGNGAGAAVLGVGSGGAFTGINYGLYALASGAAAVTPSAAINTANNGTGNDVFVNYWSGGTDYKIMGTAPGTVACSVQDTKGNYVVMHAPETPEAYFEDYGQGQLVNGKVHIDIDPTYAKNICVNEKHPLRVYVQLEGDCKGVYVTNKTATGFDVVELNGGNSNVSFQYHIIGNEADAVMPSGITCKFADLRFEPTPKAPEAIVSPPVSNSLQQVSMPQMAISTINTKAMPKPLNLPVQSSFQAVPTTGGQGSQNK